MKDIKPVLAVIPARHGSKGLPGKNIRPLAGLPLIAHSILLAKMCPEIDQIVVSTDSPEIAKVAAEQGAPAPFLRPAHLGEDDTPMWPVLQHALATMERVDQRSYGSVLLLDPTSPGRLPEDVAGAVARLSQNADADGIVGVSQPEFNPIWHCVIERNGQMENLIADAGRYHRRQDVPTVYRINASLYLWRARFVAEARNWRDGRMLLWEIPEFRALHIDDVFEFDKADVLIRTGLIRLPWLTKNRSEQNAQ